LDGYVLTGTTTKVSDGVVYTVNMTFNPEVTSMTGLWGYTSSSNYTYTRTSDITVKIFSPPLTLSLGESHQFRSGVAGALDTRVAWTINRGTIPNGLFTPTEAGIYTITATSVADPSKQATTKVRVTDGNPLASLVGHWTFEDSSNTFTADVSGYRHNGSLYNDATRAQGRFGMGQALQFNGIDTYMETPSTQALSPDSISISLWLKLDSEPNVNGNDNWRSILYKGTRADKVTTGYAVVLGEKRNIAWDTGTSSSDNWWPRGITIPIDRWTNIVLVYDATLGMKQAYQDGMLMDTKMITPAVLAPNYNPLRLSHPSGSASPSGNGNFPGAVDDLRVYGRALSYSEVAQIFGPVAISPREISLKPGQSFNFQVSPTYGGTLPQLAWATNGGTIDPTGEYIAPKQTGDYTVAVFNAYDPTQLDTALVRVRDFDASRDFSTTDNPTGQWSYGWMPAQQNTFTLFHRTNTTSYNLIEWLGSSSYPYIGINPTEKLITYSNSNIFPRNLYVYPGSSGQKPVLRWTAPEDGIFNFNSIFMGFESNPTNGVYVLKNGTSIFDGSINQYMKGPAFSQSIELQTEDIIDFTVGYDENYSYSSYRTYLSATINRVRPSITIHPSNSLSLPIGQSVAFSATVNGLGSQEVVWSVEEGSLGGAITADGVYTASSYPGIYHVKATSAVDRTVIAKAIIQVVY
jgi:hypothetical protein